MKNCLVEKHIAIGSELSDTHGFYKNLPWLSFSQQKESLQSSRGY
jgi:hypothetical protein